MSDSETRELEGAFQSNARYFEIMRAHHRRRGVGIEPEMREILTSSPGGSVLDLGCGEGSIVNWLATRGDHERYVAIDISPIGTRMGRDADTTGRVRYTRGNLLSLPYRDGAFDLVYAQSVLEHVADHTAAIAEIVRVLRPGGICAIRLPNGARSGRYGLLGALAREVLGRNGVRRLRPNLVLERDEDSLENFDACHVPAQTLRRDIEAAGLEIVRYTTRLDAMLSHARGSIDRLARRALLRAAHPMLRELGPTTIVAARKPARRARAAA